MFFDEAFAVAFHSRTRPGRWGCIEWVGARHCGYGRVQHEGKSLQAHRVAWMLHSGQLLGPDLVIDHMCCNKGCVNPEHLEPVTNGENTRRVTSRGRDGWVSVGNKAKWGTRRKLRGAKCKPSTVA